MYYLEDEVRTITVYEYEEAEEVIKALAVQYAEDVTPISRGGRNRNKILYYNFPCSFDIETTTIKNGEFGYKREDGRPVAFPYLFQFNIYGAVIMVRTYGHALNIFKWLGDYFIGEDRKRLVIFDHNLGYEYGFFKDFWKLEYKECFAMDLHHPVTLMLTNGLMLRDSYKMSNMSLETLTKDWSKVWKKKPEIMDYNIRRTPYTELDENTLLYSALDVLSLSDAMQGFLSAHDTGVWTRSPTSTSFIRAALKKTIGFGVKKRSEEQKAYFKLLKKCEITQDIYNMLLREARGGNTHANRRITGQYIKDVAHFDITSSYPAQMVCYPEFPLDYWYQLDGDCSIDSIKLFEENGYCTLFDMCLINPRIKKGVTVPYIPMYKARTLKGFSEYSDNGRYLKGAEMLETTLFGIEWPIIESQYDFDDLVIVRGYFAKKGYLPDIIRRFVLDLYAQKTELKGVAGKEIEYSLAKTYVNGVYGMSYTRIIRIKYEFDSHGIFETEPKDAEEELTRYHKSTSYFMPYAWGAMVATLGRVYLQRMIDAAGPDFLYCDTDSVFIKNASKAKPKIKKLEQNICEYQRRCGLDLVYYDIKGRPHELGGITDEGNCDFMTYGAKKYITVENGKLKCTIAGVPKKAGAKIIGSPEGFKLGMVFKGRETNKLCLWYNDNENLNLTDNGRPIECYSNIAMLPVDYILGLSDDYTNCLRLEGINKLYSFNQLHTNMNEEYI